MQALRPASRFSCHGKEGCGRGGENRKPGTYAAAPQSRHCEAPSLVPRHCEPAKRVWQSVSPVQAPVSRPPSFVPRPSSPVFRPPSSVPRLPSFVPRLPSFVSRPSSPVPRKLRGISRGPQPPGRWGRIPRPYSPEYGAAPFGRCWKIPAKRPSQIETICFDLKRRSHRAIRSFRSITVLRKRSERRALRRGPPEATGLVNE